MKNSHTQLQVSQVLSQILTVQIGSCGQAEKIEFSRKKIKSKIKKSDYI